LWHATKCWLEQLRRQLADKSRFRDAFDSLYAIMFLDASGTLDERTAAVDAKIAAFKVAFEDESAVVEYFVRHWEKKKGAGRSPLVLT
jgi:uracil phosphoribosyltransferase